MKNKVLFFLFSILSIYSISVEAQNLQTKYKVSNKKAIRAQVMDCTVGNDGACYVDMLIENIGKWGDIELVIPNPDSDPNKAIDNTGRYYSGVKYAIGDMSKYLIYYTTDIILPEGVPLKCRVKIDDISPDAIYIKELSLNIYNKLDYQYRYRMLKIMNIPILR